MINCFTELKVFSSQSDILQHYIFLYIFETSEYAENKCPPFFILILLRSMFVICLLFKYKILLFE